MILIKTKPIILLGLILIILVNTSWSYLNRSNDCSNLRRGNFVFHYRGLDKNIDFLINRNDSIQIETDKESGQFSKLGIRWTSNCSYELKLLETTFAFPDSIQQMRKKFPLKTDILSLDDKYYIFQSKRENTDFILVDTLWIVK